MQNAWNLGFSVSEVFPQSGAPDLNPTAAAYQFNKHKNK